MPGAGYSVAAMEDAYDVVLALPDLKTKIWKTPGAGATGKPFRVERGASG